MFRGRLSEQPIELIVVDHVAFARGGFEPVTVGDCELAVMISDQPGALQVPGGGGNPSPPNAELHSVASATRT